MRFAATLALLSSAGSALAATTTAAAAQATGSCQAQNIVDACRSGIQTQIDKCAANDWVCLCNNYTNLLTCYNNCPDSSDRAPVQNQVTQYCLAAAPLISSSLAAASTRGPVSVAPATTATATLSDASTATASRAVTASAFNTGAAPAVGAPIGGALAVLLGVAGLL